MTPTWEINFLQNSSVVKLSETKTGLGKVRIMGPKMRRREMKSIQF